MCKIIGVDKGTAFTKTNEGLCIRSTLRRMRKDEFVLNAEKTVLEVNGIEYIVGEQGSFGTDLLKATHENTTILSVTALAMTEGNVFDMVTGVPIAMYRNQKQRMKELFKDTQWNITLNGVKKNISIKNVEIFPEAAGAFFSQSAIKDAIVVDIGGLSVDVAQFKGGKLVNSSTYPKGTLKLYSKIANYLNAQYAISLKEWDIHNVLLNGLYLYGNKINIDLDELLFTHTNDIASDIMLDYDIAAEKNVLFAGGAAEWLMGYVGMPQAIIIDDPQFANVKGYYNVGKKLFGNDTKIK